MENVVNLLACHMETFPPGVEASTADVVDVPEAVAREDVAEVARAVQLRERLVLLRVREPVRGTPVSARSGRTLLTPSRDAFLPPDMVCET